jgi:hypothetical protein
MYWSRHRSAARPPEQDRCRLYTCAWWKAVGSASCFVRHDALTCFFYVTPPCEFRKSNMRFLCAPDPRLATCRKKALCGVPYDHQNLTAKVEVGGDISSLRGISFGAAARFADHRRPRRPIPVRAFLRHAAGGSTVRAVGKMIVGRGRRPIPRRTHGGKWKSLHHYPGVECIGQRFSSHLSCHPTALRDAAQGGGLIGS